MKSLHCTWCGNRTMGSSGLCRTCKSAHHHAHKRIEEEKLHVGMAGDSWWVWTVKGEVLVIGKATKAAAIKSLALGDEDAEA